MGNLILNNLKDLEPEREAFYMSKINTIKTLRNLIIALLFGFIVGVMVLEVILNKQDEDSCNTDEY